MSVSTCRAVVRCDQCVRQYLDSMSSNEGEPSGTGVGAAVGVGEPDDVGVGEPNAAKAEERSERNMPPEFGATPACVALLNGGALGSVCGVALGC